MKKILIIFAVLFANGILLSCTDLGENQEQILQEELQNTGGEDEQDPDEEDEDEEPESTTGENDSDPDPEEDPDDD